MIQQLVQSEFLTFEEFLKWYPENGRYELIDGIIFEMQPTGKHEEVVGFIATKLTLAVDRLELPYKLPRRALIKPPSRDTGFLPDVMLVKASALPTEPLWASAATLADGSSIPLVVEVVSTNWEADYARKLEEYEAMGIPEYWIADHAGLGGKRYIGSPKQPTFSVCLLVDGEYQIKRFQGGDRIESLLFPDLNLTVEQIFRAGE